MKLTSKVLLFAIGLSLLLQGTSLHAATPKPDVTISPFLREIRFAGNEPTTEFDITLTNNSDKEQNFNLTILDFGSLNESGGVVFEGSNASSLLKKYGLSHWLLLSSKKLSLEPGKSAQIVATIINDVTLRPGGHYGAIVASLNNPDASRPNQIAVNQKLSSLIFVTKMGGEKYDLKLKAIDVSGGRFKLPAVVTLHFNNPGNVHVVPRGIVKLVSPNGKVVSQGIINEDSSFVLPETSRQLKVEMKNVGSIGLWPAMYRVQVDYRYEGYEKFAHKERSVYFINLVSLILLILAVAAGAYYIVKIHHKPSIKDGIK